MKRYLSIACFALAGLLMAGSLAGCGKNDQSSPAPSAGRVKAQAERTVTKIQKANPKKVAAHLEALARGVPGVKGANCVVFGKYAVVGIDVDDKMERSQVGTLKYAVAEAFRKDPYGIEAVVTADMDLAQRVREIKADVKHGRPIAGFAEELADIVGRLVPQMPRNIIPPKSPENFGTSNVDKLKK